MALLKTKIPACTATVPHRPMAEDVKAAMGKMSRVLRFSATKTAAGAAQAMSQRGTEVWRRIVPTRSRLLRLRQPAAKEIATAASF